MDNFCSFLVALTADGADGDELRNAFEQRPFTVAGGDPWNLTEDEVAIILQANPAEIDRKLAVCGLQATISITTTIRVI